MAQSAELDRAKQMFAEMLGRLPTDRAPTMDDMRVSYDTMCAEFEIPADARIEDVDAAGVPSIWVAAAGTSADRTVVMLHGGGYCIGSAKGYRAFACAISRATDARVLVVDYRLAPEHPHPAAVDDAVAVYRFLLDEGGDPARTVILGDSAGGGLVVATLMALRDQGAPPPGAGVALSPLADLSGESDSMVRNADIDPIVSSELITGMGGAYLAGADPKQTPLASPIHGDLSDLPPLLVLVGTAETLLDDSTTLAERIEAAGGQVELTIEEDMIHVYPVFQEFLPEARAAVERIGTFVRSHTGARVG